MDRPHLFHHRRNSAAATDPAVGRAEIAGNTVGSENEHRHPAMRGLDVSPVHGHHCICDRCNQQRAA